MTISDRTKKCKYRRTKIESKTINAICIKRIKTVCNCK